MRDEWNKSAGYYTADDGDIDAFRVLIDRTLDPASVPQAASIEKNVPIYDMGALAPALDDPQKRRVLMAEWADVLRNTAGVIVLKAAYADTAPIDRATGVFNAIIVDERHDGAGKGDHFAASGANDRIWNSLQKHCLHDAAGFARYYGNTAIAAVAEAWLGPAYQMTAQVNQVRPGGKAQQAHRDYHLGFQTAQQAARYPVHAHDLTAALTLQGAIAHCDMPVESGPTKLLPFSQLYDAGYIAFHDPDHRAMFEDRCIQLPLAKGDAVFFNPALFHGAGDNRSADIARMVNLLQVSSAFGRAMESVDRGAMVRELFPILADTDLTAAQADAVIAASAEGYPFPTNLDTDPPVGGNAPPSQADLMRQALAERWDADRFDTALKDMDHRRWP
ncbi:phytanoyl-CoA dioxygenase family protein [Loktanella sp. SALINAS62]|uniref:phytanoyl-CoA dioxygenase family protein n=1 Tax=Loktanella sp. SALINAS62 TaxID=2706124 RepID=UPI001B8C9C27|nr:phytanoyl-CoA dioxygenase family protein [Loktanella sp. SALINAS62]MBS1301167.1 phytanoyl-CoA dioxygenase [Loktanella sp. SALINAS62]